MSVPRPYGQPQKRLASIVYPGADAPSSLQPASSSAVFGKDWKGWLRTVQRKRKLVVRRGADRDERLKRPRCRRPREDRNFLARVSGASFEIDGIELAEGELVDAFVPGACRRPFRSRQLQRLRNHAAILRRIAWLPRRCQPLEVAMVVRWYTSISCGLSSAELDGPTLSRLTRVVRQINSPHLNLRPAIEEIARLYVELLTDPIVPSFNGILARLLLGCHLGRCGLPPVLFDPQRDMRCPESSARLLPRLLELVQESYDALIASAKIGVGAG